MDGENKLQNCIRLLDPKKQADKTWFLALLDDEKQRLYEEERLKALLIMLRLTKINALKKQLVAADEELGELRKKISKNAETYCRIKELRAEKLRLAAEIEKCRPFFDEPYFARMDVVDDKEGYNSYYIGKRGDMRLEIVDWRAPIARRYYQKSSVRFSINEYDYRVILRRALRVKAGKIDGFKNEFLSVRDYLSREEISGRDEEILFDPYLREILKSRKEETNVRDIIETIQEKQYAVISLPERESFVLQGCAGSGKTMVMLHRLSYLMYNDENVRPRDVLLITPGDSFNEFIEELAEILQLEKVRAMTVGEYFSKVLSRSGIDAESKIDDSAKENEEYLRYLYSPAFARDIQKKVGKTYDNLYGIFTGEECREYVDALVKRTEEQLAAYEKVKNASLRIRRAVLGEIKERKDGGGVYYTKPFRYLMNAVTVVNDFLKNVVKEEKSGVPAYFFRQILTFYSNAAYLAKKTEEICTDALSSLGELSATVEKELADVKRYKSSAGGNVSVSRTAGGKRGIACGNKKSYCESGNDRRNERRFCGILRVSARRKHVCGAWERREFRRRSALFLPGNGEKIQAEIRHGRARALSFGSLRVVRASGGDGRRTAPRVFVCFCGRGAGYIHGRIRAASENQCPRGV